MSSSNPRIAYHKVAVILNPHAGNGRATPNWKAVQHNIASHIDEIDEFVTTRTGDATQFAKQIAESSYDLLLVAGGDGTINEVVNGLMNREKRAQNPRLHISILNSGRGCDFARTLQIPTSQKKYLEFLQYPHPQAIDVGHVTLHATSGKIAHQYFMNIASAGMSAAVARNVNRVPRIIPPRLAYLITGVVGFLSGQPQQMTVKIDGTSVFSGPSLNIFIANAKYSGAGMCWAPQALADDGLFDVILIGELPKYKVIQALARIYDGSFLKLPGIHFWRGRSVELEVGSPISLELDGEQPGQSPAHFTILPQALTFLTGAIKSSHKRSCH